MLKNLEKNYSPLFFLSALGSGGLTVAFFIFFMFMMPHPDSPIATFDSVFATIMESPWYVAVLSALCYGFMLYYAVNHLRLLTWNIREYRIYRKTPAFEAIKKSNKEVTLMAIPLTLTMTINVMFVLGAMLVPGLWGFVELLFPLAFMAFLATGVYSLVVFYRYYSNLLINGHFEHSKNNSLSQLLSSFTFAMNAVGFAAPAAMSENMLIVPMAAFCSIFFFVAATLLAVKNFVLGFNAMMRHGIDREGSASIWILIPILTLLGITAIRLHHGLGELFLMHGSPAFHFIFCSSVVSLQIFFGFLGYMIMRQNNYFPEFIHGISNSDSKEAVKTPATYALICPGVAFWVFSMFFLDKALVNSNLLTLFSLPYFVLLLPMLLVLLKTMQVNWKLNKRLLHDSKS